MKQLLYVSAPNSGVGVHMDPIALMTILWNALKHSVCNGLFGYVHTCETVHPEINIASGMPPFLIMCVGVERRHRWQSGPTKH